MTSNAIPARICLVGIRGFGERHLENIRALESEHVVTLACAVDLQGAGEPLLGADVTIYRTLEDLAAAGEQVDVIIVSTPIASHYALGRAAVDLGADLLLEKPPTATLAQHAALVDSARAAGTLVQVGFQSLGSHALPAIAELVDSGRIGALRAVGATGPWRRDAAYYARTPWAGRRVLDGTPVVDGVVTNPLAHAVATALSIAGAHTAADVTGIVTDLYRANPIEADDTSVVRIRTAAGIPVTCALTTTSDEQQDPFITISGTEGTAILHYTRDELTITDAAGEPSMHTYGRTNLLANLVACRGGTAAELLAPLDRTGAFMCVLEAVRTAADPRVIDPDFLHATGTGPERHLGVASIDDYLDRAVKSQATFSSLAAPWAAEPPSGESLRVGNREVARVRLGTEIAPDNSPRPFLHPVRTLAGTTVSDQQPLDHTWHLGVGVAIQDVDGVNFWGGRTYTRAAGRYVWREDHGHIVRHTSHLAGSGLTEALTWFGPGGGSLLEERRTIAASAGPDGCWRLDYSFTLSPSGDSPVSLGSPGSNGRAGGGYGGFFWRLPRAAGVEVFTTSARGEDAVHGSTAPWLAFAAEFPEGPATLIFAADDDDPWFVRHAGYPGVGRSLAWDRRVETTRADPIQRTVRVLVADGRLDQTAVGNLMAGVSAGA